jgi:hypothetical protein
MRASTSGDMPGPLSTIEMRTPWSALSVRTMMRRS